MTSLFRPSNPSPLISQTLMSPPETPILQTLPIQSHYYRPPRSTLTSPARSNISSPAGSPTRTSRQTRIQSLLANDPLLSRLTPATIARLSNDPEFGFTPAEKEWSIRAAEGIVRVGEWLREVEGWNVQWRRSKGRDAGDGYLPPRPKKRRKVSVISVGTEMGSIAEEDEEGEDSDEEEARNLLIKKRNSKPPTPYQLNLQKQRAGTAVTPSKGNRPLYDEYDGESTDEEDEEEIDESEYCGSLKKTTIEQYLERIEQIKSEIEELDVEALKSKVLAYRTGISNPLTDSSAIITAITLQLLPPLHRLTKLLSAWAVRLAVLRIVPVFLRWLQIAKDSLDAGYAAINHPSIAPSQDTSDDEWRGLEESTFGLMQETITAKVATAGRLMDTMLDALEGREDVLPDLWITELEDVEERVGAWEMDGERVVIAGKLRLEELRQTETKREELLREMERNRLVEEQQRYAEEARGAECVAESVMERAEETERGLRETMEANEEVTENIELVGDNYDEDASGDENDYEPREMDELLMRLEGVEKDRLFSRDNSDSEAEDVRHADVFERSRRGLRIDGGGSSSIDAFPALDHELSLGNNARPEASTAFHTPMPTPGIMQDHDQLRKDSTATDYYTPMPTPGITTALNQTTTSDSDGSITPTQFHTPMPTPRVPFPPQPDSEASSSRRGSATPTIQFPASLMFGDQPPLRRQSSTPFHTPMTTPALMAAFQHGPPLLRRQPSMPCMPVPKLPPTAQVFAATARREPPSPETPKRAEAENTQEEAKEVKKTTPKPKVNILAAARSFFKSPKAESKKSRAKKEEEAKKEEARKKEEEEREMIEAVNAETERLSKLEEAERERTEKINAVKMKLAEAERLREVERAAREVEERKKVAEAERKRVIEEEARERKAREEEEERLAQEELRVKIEEEEEAERLRRASIERVSVLEAVNLATEAEHQRLLAQEASIIAEQARQQMAEEEEERSRLFEAEKQALLEQERIAEVERLAVAEAARVKAEEEAERERRAEMDRLTAEAQAEAERQRLAEEEAALERQAESERLAAVEEAARLQAEKDAEAESLRLIVEERDRLAAEEEAARIEAEEQAEAERLAAAEVARIEAEEEAEHFRMIQEEAEAERLAALEAARIEADEEAERSRMIQEEEERERLASIEAARLEAEEVAEAERLRLIEEEDERLDAIEAARLMAEEEAEAERLRLISEEEEEEERERQVEAERLSAEEERQRLYFEEEERMRQAEADVAAERLRLAKEELEAKRQIEVQRVAAVAMARLAAEEEQRRQAETERLAAEEAARLAVETEAEAERLRLAEEEAERERQEEERAVALEIARLEAEAEEKAERLRVLEEESTRLKAEEEAEKQRQELERQGEIERLAVLEAEAAEEARHAEAAAYALIQEAECKLEEDRRRAMQEEARINAELHAEAIRQAEEEAARQSKAELELLAIIEAENAAREEAERQRVFKLEDERRKAIEEEARRSAGFHADAVRLAEEDVAHQRIIELERLAKIKAERAEREEEELQRIVQLEVDRLRAVVQEAENERLINLELERLKVEQEAEIQRLAALEASRLELESEQIAAIAAAEEAERQQEEEIIAEAQRSENKRLADLNDVRLAAEAEVEIEIQAELERQLQRAIGDEEIQRIVREQEQKDMERIEEEERSINEQIQRQMAEQQAIIEAEAETERQLIAQLQLEVQEAIAETERKKEKEDKDLHRQLAAFNDSMDSDDEMQFQLTPETKRAAPEAETKYQRQQAIDDKAEKEMQAKKLASELERERLHALEQERRWEINEEAAYKQAIQEEEKIHRQIAAQEKRWAHEEEIEKKRFAHAENESDLTFEEMDLRRRLAEDERQRLEDLALVKREQERLAAQEAERLAMEQRIENDRLEAERLREEEEERQRQAQFSNHHGSNSEGDFLSGDDITEDYQDLSLTKIPFKESDEDSGSLGSENMAYAEARKNQPSVPPSITLTPISSRSSSILHQTKYKTPETNKEVPPTPWSQESTSPEISPDMSKSQGNASESYSDLEEDLVAVENLAAHLSLQKALNGNDDSGEYELPQTRQSSDQELSDSSFDGLPCILIAPSTPGDRSDFEDTGTPKTANGAWDNVANSPVFEDGSPSGSYAGGSTPSNLRIDANGYPTEDDDAEDISDLEVVPVATSTPKSKRRPGALGGLDSITEVQTPYSPRDGSFPSDTHAFGTPSKKSGKSSDLMLKGGLSVQDSPSARRRSFNDKFKVGPISLDLGLGNREASTQNRVCNLSADLQNHIDTNKFAKRSTTPEPKAPIKVEKSQKLIRKAPLDMAKPRSLSSTGHYISPGSTVRTGSRSPTKTPTKTGPALKAIRRPHKEIDSDDEGSVISEQRWPRSNELTPDRNSSPPTNTGVPRLNVQKRQLPRPAKIDTVTPERNRKLYQKNPQDDDDGSQSFTMTPKLEFPQPSLDDKVNDILTSLKSPIRLTASNLQKLTETSKRSGPLRPFELPPSSIPAPKSVAGSSVVSDATGFAPRGGRRHVSNASAGIELYHLHRDNGQAPIKLYIRLVGERGERVMVRVGGGWADLAEYLKEYATHHGSKRRTVSGGGIEIQDLGGGAQHHSLHAVRSRSSLRSNSPAPGQSRSGSPPEARSRSVSAVGLRSRPNSALGVRPGSSLGNRPGSSLGNRPSSSMGNSPGSSMGVRGRERSSSLVQPATVNSPPIMRGGHDGTKDRPTLTPFQPLAYQRQSAFSPQNGMSPPSGIRPPSRGQSAVRPPSRGQGAIRPPSRQGAPPPVSRPGSSHGALRRSTSRLSFSESAFDPSEAGSSTEAPPPKPLGLAGPKGKNTVISPQDQAWVDGMIGEVRKVSARKRRLTGGSVSGDMGLGDEPFVIPGELVEVQPGVQQFGSPRLEMGDLGKQGGTRRVFPKKT